MATVTIRGLPDELVARIKAAAALNGHSMEQEVRLALADRYRELELELERVQLQNSSHAPGAMQAGRHL